MLFAPSLRPRSGPRHGAVALATALALAAPGVASPSLAAAPVNADASAKARADALSDRAVQHFDDEEFDEAIDLFEQALALDAQPNYLFNIGRVYEEQGDLARAVEYYQRFVGSKGVDIEARHNATERLQVLKQALDALEVKAKTEPRPAVEPNPDEDRSEGGNRKGNEDDPPPDRKRAVRIAGYSLLGVGGATLIVGGVFGGLALNTRNDAAGERFVDDALGMRTRAKTQARVADGLFITGGAIAGTGLVLALWTLRAKAKTSGDAARASAASSQRPTLRGASAWATPRAGGVSLAGNF